MTQTTTETEARSISEIKEDLEHLDSIWDAQPSFSTTS